MKLKRFLVLIMALAEIVLLNGCAGRSEQTVGGSSAKSSGSDSSGLWPTESWSVSTPEAQGIDPDEFSKADSYIKDDYPNVYSLLVVRHGYLVYEKYYQGAKEKDAYQVYSVTKSIMSALTGIAMQHGLIKGIDQTVGELLPEYFTKIDDARKKDITIKNVLTMTGGLDSIDNAYGNYFSSSDWLEQTLKKPLIDEPGTKFVYNTGLTQFLSGIITKTSGMDTKEYAEKYLFSEIGINAENWLHDSKGYYGGGTGLYLTPRDMAKFGYLYLNNGKWNGKQIIPENWVSESTKKHLYAYNNMDYGYLFWSKTVHDASGDADYSAYWADGAGGQKIIVIPQLDMVAVVTANPSSAYSDKTDTQNIVFNYVIPAVD